MRNYYKRNGCVQMMRHYTNEDFTSKTESKIVRTLQALESVSSATASDATPKSSLIHVFVIVFKLCQMLCSNLLLLVIVRRLLTHLILLRLRALVHSEDLPIRSCQFIVHKPSQMQTAHVVLLFRRKNEVKQHLRRISQVVHTLSIVLVEPFRRIGRR